MKWYVISTDVKKSSFLWQKDFTTMFKSLLWHHAIIRSCFIAYGFEICNSSPEGDAFIASKLTSEEEAKQCIQSIIYWMDNYRNTGMLNVGGWLTTKDQWRNRIHIRIGLASGETEPAPAATYNVQCKTNTICSNPIVWASEEAEVKCKGWSKHYGVYKDGNVTTKQELMIPGKVNDKLIMRSYKIPEVKEIQTGLVLFLHKICKENNNYCGSIASLMDVIKGFDQNWKIIKIKRDRSAMLFNTSVNSAMEARQDFDNIIKNGFSLGCAYGPFKKILMNTCSDIFGDTVNAAARMKTQLCFMEEPPPSVPTRAIERQKLNLGKYGYVYVYTPGSAGTSGGINDKLKKIKF
jgi:hypothetical protein